MLSLSLNMHQPQTLSKSINSVGACMGGGMGTACKGPGVNINNNIGSNIQFQKLILSTGKITDIKEDPSWNPCCVVYKIKVRPCSQMGHHPTFSCLFHFAVSTKTDGQVPDTGPRQNNVVLLFIH